MKKTSIIIKIILIISIMVPQSYGSISYLKSPGYAELNTTAVADDLKGKKTRSGIVNIAEKARAVLGLEDKLSPLGWSASKKYLSFMRKFKAISALATKEEDLTDPVEAKLRQQLKKEFYFHTTEPDWYKNLTPIQNIKSDGIYLGTSSGAQIFSHLCQNDFPLAILVDFNPYVTDVFVPIMFSLASMAKSRAEFLALISGIKYSRKLKKLATNAASLHDITEIILNELQQAKEKPNSRQAKAVSARRERIWQHIKANISPEIQEEAKDFWINFSNTDLRLRLYQLDDRLGQGRGSWLDNENNYAKIQDMIINNKILYIPGDWSSRELFDKINQELANMEDPAMRKVSVVNISNLQEWIYRAYGDDKVNDLIANIRSLPSRDDAILIKQNQLYYGPKGEGIGTKIILKSEFDSMQTPGEYLLPGYIGPDGKSLNEFEPAVVRIRREHAEQMAAQAGPVEQPVAAAVNATASSL